MIIIPMAGLSRRFLDAGYQRPKYELPLAGATLFSAAVRSFERYFASERFVFVCRSGVDAERFIDDQCRRIGLSQREVVTLDAATRGQAETVLLGLEAVGGRGDGAAAGMDAESLLIFNIDTIRPDYEFPTPADAADGYLEVFQGDGDGWSFVKPAAAFSRRVALTTEKFRISPLCCTGLYHFARIGDFMRACRHALDTVDAYRNQWGEVYVAPLYNMLIAAGQTVVYHEVAASAVHLSGTPAQYATLRQREVPLF